MTYFETFSVPTADTLFLLLLSILALESAHSIRFLYEHFKLKLAASMIRQVMPEFGSKEHVIILCDSWYTKQNLVSIVDEYPNLDLVGNARIDSVMYDLAPARTGRRGRPAKHGRRLSVETDFTFSNEKIGDYYTGIPGFSLRSSATGKSLPMSLPLTKRMAQNDCFSVLFSRKICRFSVPGRKKRH